MMSRTNFRRNNRHTSSRRTVPFLSFSKLVAVVTIVAIILVVVWSRVTVPVVTEKICDSPQQMLTKARIWSRKHPDDYAGNVNRFRDVHLKYTGSSQAAEAYVELKQWQDELNARNALKTIEASQVNNTQNSIRIEASYSDIATRYANTKAGKEASQRVVSLISIRNQKFALDLYKVNDAADNAVKQDDYCKALFFYDDLASRFTSPDAIVKINKGRNKIKVAAWEKFKEIRKQGEELLSAKKFDAAKRIIEPTFFFGIDDVGLAAAAFRRKVNDTLSEIKSIDPNLSESQIKVLRKEFMAPIEIAAEAKQYITAYRICDDLIECCPYKFEEVLEDRSIILKYLALFQREAINTIKETDPPLNTKGVSRHLPKGILVGADEEGLSIQTNSGKTKVLWSDLNKSTMIKIIHTFVNENTPNNKCLMGTLYSELGYTKGALKLFDEAKKTGANIESFQVVLIRCQSSQKTSEKSKQESFAEKAFITLKNKIKLKKWSDAKRILGILDTKYSSTKFYGCKSKALVPMAETIAVGMSVCPMCLGRGVVDCPHCVNGHRLRPCPHCVNHNVAAKRFCKHCKGSGFVTDPRRCPTCRGRGVLPCPRCNATGKRPGY